MIRKETERANEKNEKQKKKKKKKQKKNTTKRHGRKNIQVDSPKVASAMP